MHKLDLSAAAGFPCAPLPTPAPPEMLAVAVSGGPDSMALCRVLSLWSAANGDIPVHAFTIDHGLRAESEHEARQVGQWLAAWPNVSHRIITLDLAGTDSRVMETARRARYEALAAACRDAGAKFLFLAHHRDDQAETFLFRLAKGSGLDGLAGMEAMSAYDDNLTLARPFLTAGKDELIAFCEAQGIPFVNDPTNENPDYARPRLRAARAALEAEGLSAKRLAVTAARMGRARAALDHCAQKLFAESLKRKTDDGYIFSWEQLAAAPAEIRLRVLLRAMAELAEDDTGYGPRRENLEDLEADLFSAPPFRRRTLGGVIVGLEKGLVEIVREEPPRRREEEIKTTNGHE
jgi:tRNA(Ile)-lysidine synthase